MSLQVNISVSYSKGLDKDIEEGLMQAIDFALEEGAEQILDISKTNFQRFVYPPIDTGQLLASGEIHSKFLDKTVIYDNSYAMYVEFGSGPHMPPFEPIRDWVWRKRSAFNMPRRIKKLDKRIDALTNKIRWSIFKHGIVEKSFLRNAFHVVKFRLVGIIRKYVKSYLSQLRAK